MDPDSKKLLEETFALVKENHEMLKRVRRVQKQQAFFRFMYWVFIIGISIGAFYFLQPYINQTQQFFKDTGTSFDKFRGMMP